MNEDGFSSDDETFEDEELGQDDSADQYEPFDAKKSTYRLLLQRSAP